MLCSYTLRATNNNIMSASKLALLCAEYSTRINTVITGFHLLVIGALKTLICQYW